MIKRGDNSFGTASVVLGILSITFACGVLLGSPAGLGLGIVSLIFALKQRKSSKNSWSSWGLGLSLVGIILSIIFLIMLAQMLSEVVNQLKELKSSGVLDALQAS